MRFDREKINNNKFFLRSEMNLWELEKAGRWRIPLKKKILKFFFLRTTTLKKLKRRTISFLISEFRRKGGELKRKNPEGREGRGGNSKFKKFSKEGKTGKLRGMIDVTSYYYYYYFTPLHLYLFRTCLFLFSPISRPSRVHHHH